MNSSAKFRVAIIGGGIGGLTFAVSLNKNSKNVVVDLYESAAAFTEVGAGIGVWPRVWEIYQELGLRDDLLAIASDSEQTRSVPTARVLEYRKADQTEGIDFHGNTQRIRFTSFHRAEFQAALVRHLPQSYNIYFSKRLKSYTETPSGEMVLEFLDGSTAACDILVGCDGIKSAVRSVLYHSLVKEAELAGDIAQAACFRREAIPQWSGYIAYRALFPRDRLEAACPGHPALTRSLLVCYISLHAGRTDKPLSQCFGKNKHIVIYPVSQEHFINIVAFVADFKSQGAIYPEPWVRESGKEELAALFSNWEPDVQILFNCLDKVSAWVINTLPSLHTYAGSRVALVGDAAHAMEPHQGSGAGQAAEDAFILATILGHPSVTKETLANALLIYDEIRRPFSQQIVEKSRLTGIHYDLHCPGIENVTEGASAQGAISTRQLEAIGKKLDDLITWAGTSSIMDDRDRALELLEAGLKAQV
ncbi:hypothetical protein POSPLADRAFT_1141422 [Postia placenta MAD-698-R-SB12]|uniref:FAD-binding domain-containing protein n=1 Tax=Postia placenta MAD-698-R-SB12 TaxID=670580 RepID=A0A1X6N2F0_9APHY|nr:hypothetical protein POSPLADRAFT_1141422 [Postia placenta MAD-698-R-SB12]OSX62801.1 hypothetical protein POSPLADRAFT_1141422 [Postia placenta MAD-698-R-SB12]